MYKKVVYKAFFKGILQFLIMPLCIVYFIHKYFNSFTITYFTCLILLVLLAYLLLLFIRSRKNVEEEEGVEIVNPIFTTASWAKDIIFFVGGLILLSYGSKFLVESASELAKMMEVSERIIAIVVIAVGTSLPELFTSIIAAIKKDTD